MRCRGGLLLVLACAACGSEGAEPTNVPAGPLHAIAADPQRGGDADLGYWALVNENYVSCGIPLTAYEKAFAPAPESERLPGREGKNAELPYHQTAIQTPSGVQAVTQNCLTCHAGRIDGQLVLGLGAADSDFTSDQTKLVGLAGAFLSDPAEIAELERFVDRVKVIGPYTQTASVGVNPADNLAAILFAHRDPETFEWHDPPLLQPPPEIVVPVDVPPWWHMNKKHAMFYVAAGRGDHARTMMAASTLCTDDVIEAREIDGYMPDIYAYLRTLEAPPYPFPVDTELAEQGRELFERTCSTCHGSYGDPETYPNLWIELDYVGTDGTLALGASQFADRFLAWFAESFYGEVSRLEPQVGYVAPPLDGIWATAPYFHNGSVPTVEALLDSTRRPAIWTRSFESTDYDQSALGWNHTALDAPAGIMSYDTSRLGYGNGGHTFGDALSDEERRAIIEYLKTL